MDKSKIFAIVGITALVGIGIAYLLSKPKLPIEEPKKDVKTADDLVNGGGGTGGDGGSDTGGSDTGGDTGGGGYYSYGGGSYDYLAASYNA